MATMPDRFTSVVAIGEEARRAISMLGDEDLRVAADESVAALRAIAAEDVSGDADVIAAQADDHLRHLDDLLSQSAAHAAERCGVIADRLASLEEWGSASGASSVAAQLAQNLARAGR